MWVHIIGNFTFPTGKCSNPHLFSSQSVVAIPLRRTHHDVKAGILKSCSFDSVSVSQLLASQNLSYKILKPILDHLVLAKLVEFEIDGRRKLVRTTDLGLTAFRAYVNALALLEGHKTSLTIKQSVKPSEARQNDRGTLS